MSTATALDRPELAGAGQPDLGWRTRYAATLVAADAATATAAAAAAPLLHLAAGASRVGTRYLVGLAVFPVLWVFAVYAGRGYERRFLGTGSEEYRRVVNAAARYAAVACGAAFGLRLAIPRSIVLATFPLATVGALATRALARRVLRRARRRGRCAHRVLLVGTERSIAELVRQVRREPDTGFQVVGACLDRSRDTEVEGVPVLGGSGAVLAALRSSGADTIAVTAWSVLSQQQLRRLAWELEGSGVDLVVAPAITDVAGPRIHIRPVAGLPLLHVEQPELSGSRRLLKGAFDRVVALAALLLLAPVLLAVGLAVRLTSPGPALFRQTRVGRRGSTFTMVKFRSMHVDAESRLADLAAANEATDGLLFKIRDDPRVTRVGRWMRRYSVDELPQLLNVLAGSMSLVGPRPPLPTEVARYEDAVHRRLLVKPGLTGLWQVSGRSDLSWEESVRLDLDYVENWTLALDLMILWRTGSAVLGSHGAY